MHAYFFNRRNTLIVTFEVADMDAAREWAREYNRDPGALGCVEFIGNGAKVAESSKVCTVYAPSSLPLFDR